MAVLPPFSAYSQAAPPAGTPAEVSTNYPPSATEVIKLAQAGLHDDVLLAYVKGSQSFYNLSADDVVALKNAGLSPQVITAMLNHDSALRGQPLPPSYEQKLYATKDQPKTAPPTPALPPVATVPNAPTIPNAPTAPPAPMAPLAPEVAQSIPPQSGPTPAVIAQQAPPPPQVEVIPVAPGPDYCWVGGYWAWRGGWVWIRGTWVIRPWHGAIWVGGHWTPHGRGHIWIGGRWR